MTPFQKQTTTIIVYCLDGLDSETFHNSSFSTIATAAITGIPLYYKNVCFLKTIVKCLRKGTHFAKIIYRAYKQLTPFYDNVS